MNKKQKLEQLKALKESFIATQAKLAKAKKLEESLRPAGIRTLLEAELAQAEVILAAQDFSSKLQSMAEDLAKMQAESIPLGDSIRQSFSSELASDFENTVNDAVQDALATIRKSKEAIANSILRVEGKEAPAAELPGGDMGSEIGGAVEVDADHEIDADLKADDLDDVFGGAEASAGPVDEPLGRGMKESYKSIGKKLLVRESIESLVSWLFEDVAPAMEPAKLGQFATQIATRSAQDPERLAGWIGSRKYGSGIKAQLASPFGDADDDILDEGKSYKFDSDEDDDVDAKKKSDRNRRNSAKSKREVEVELEEGKSHKYDADEDDDVDSKKKSNRERRDAGKAKRSIEEALQLVIERNIAKTGKGMAAKAIAETLSMFPMVESSDVSLAEAFEARFGMTPQAYSIKKARAVAEATTLTQRDEKNAANIMATVAADSEKDKNLEKKGVQQVLNKMQAQDRTTAQKVINNAKSLGHKVTNVGELVSATKGELDGTLKRVDQKDPNAVEENINAAQWPVASDGQYKGKAMSSANKLKPAKIKSDYTSVPKTPKGPDAPSAKTNWTGASEPGIKAPVSHPVAKSPSMKAGSSLATMNSGADTVPPSMRKRK